MTNQYLEKIAESKETVGSTIKDGLKAGAIIAGSAYAGGRLGRFVGVKRVKHLAKKNGGELVYNQKGKLDGYVTKGAKGKMPNGIAGDDTISRYTDSGAVGGAVAGTAYASARREKRKNKYLEKAAIHYSHSVYVTNAKDGKHVVMAKDSSKAKYSAAGGGALGAIIGGGGAAHITKSKAGRAAAAIAGAAGVGTLGYKSQRKLEKKVDWATSNYVAHRVGKGDIDKVYSAKKGGLMKRKNSGGKTELDSKNSKLVWQKDKGFTSE